MSKELQSILLEDFEITVPGFRLRRLALNQHMPRVEKLSEHVHDWFQALLICGDTECRTWMGEPCPSSAEAGL